MTEKLKCECDCGCKRKGKLMPYTQRIRCYGCNNRLCQVAD